MVGCDPDGLPWRTLAMTAALAEATKRVPPRAVCIPEYYEVEQDQTWEGLAQL